MTMVRISIMPNEFVGNKFVNDDNIDNEYDGKLWWYAGMKNLRWIMCWGRWTTDCPPCRHLLQEHLLQRSRWDGGGCPLIQHWFRNLLQHFQLIFNPISTLNYFNSARSIWLIVSDISALLISPLQNVGNTWKLTAVTVRARSKSGVSWGRTHLYPHIGLKKLKTWKQDEMLC